MNSPSNSTQNVSFFDDNGDLRYSRAVSEDLISSASSDSSARQIYNSDFRSVGGCTRRGAAPQIAFLKVK